MIKTLQCFFNHLWYPKNIKCVSFYKFLSKEMLPLFTYHINRFCLAININILCN